MTKDDKFIQEMRDVSSATHLKCQFDQVAQLLNEMRQSRLLGMKDQTKIVEMRLELESMVKRATGPIQAAP